MKTCTHCGAQAYREESGFCAKCGQPLPEQQAETLQNINICTNPDCEWHQTRFIYPDDACFCDACGSKTMYNR